MMKTREAGIDILRSIAVLFVVSVHFFLNTSFYETPLVGYSMYFQAMLQALFMSCIPIFLLISGYVSTKTDISLKYFKKLIPILIIYICYTILAVIYRRFHMNEVKGIEEWIIDSLSFKANAYSWYVNMYIGLFLMTPFLNVLFNGLKTKRERQVLVAVFLFISAVPDFLNGRFISIMQFPNYWADFYPIGFYFLGSYIREYKPRLKKSQSLLLIAGILSFETFFECYVAKGSPYIAYMGTFASLIRLTLAAVIFIAVYQKEINNKVARNFITTVSVLSLDIYLASYISDKIVYEYVNKHIFTTQNHIIIWFVPIVLTTFTMAFAAAFVRSKLIRVRQVKSNSTDKGISISL